MEEHHYYKFALAVSEDFTRDELEDSPAMLDKLHQLFGFDSNTAAEILVHARALASVPPRNRIQPDSPEDIDSGASKDKRSHVIRQNLRLH